MYIAALYEPPTQHNIISQQAPPRGTSAHAIVSVTLLLLLLFWFRRNGLWHLCMQI